MIDTTSSAASLLMETAASTQVPVAYVTGLAMRRAADLYAGAAKTDPKDALVLADYARRNADRLSWTQLNDELLVKLRILNGRDTDLAADATRTVNRLRDALLAISPALERAIGDKLVSNPGLRDVFVSWPTPTALKAAGRSRIANRIAKHSPRAAQRLTDAITAALDAQSLTVTAETAWGDTICDLALDLNRICQHRNQLGIDINNVFMEHPLGKVLASLCGFGPRTGARTLAEIGDPHRFVNAGRLASYAGLAPVNWQSGTHNTTRKSRGGKPPTQKRHVPSSLRRRPTRPRRPRLLPTKTSRRQTPQRRRHLRRPPPLRHHLSHAQNPNPLPTNTTPTPTPSRLKRLDNKTGTPPDSRCSSTSPSSFRSGSSQPTISSTSARRDDRPGASPGGDNDGWILKHGDLRRADSSMPPRSSPNRSGQQTRVIPKRRS